MKMTTTELIELLKKHERGGATGRPREVMFEVDERIIGTDGIEVTGSGDGLISELYLSLPSAQPKNGKWEEIKVFPASEIELQSARCSACKRYHTTPYLYNYTHYNFCPHCGARMVNEDE